MRQDEAVAVVGMAALLPGAPDVKSAAATFAAGADQVGVPSLRRLRSSALPVDAAYPAGGFLDRLDEFDHAFFGISRREAELMDPHQRLVLQLAWRALEDAAIAPSRLRGTAGGVFLTPSNDDYAQLVTEPDPLVMLGTAPAALPGRVAYALDWRGPALSYEVGCCGSLVAVAAACRELAAGTVTTALAGGVAVLPVLEPAPERSPFAGILSSDGRCKAFDAAADGAGVGEGGVVLVLKLLRDALADGDPIRAVLKGFAVNSNGYRANGLSAPNPGAQAEVIRAAWRAAGVSGADIGYIEAHGSGTPLGDAVEIQGLTEALRSAGVTDIGAVPIGSVKTQMGHLDSAAGVAGLLRAVLSVELGLLYPSLHHHRANPLARLESAPVAVNTTVRTWPTSPGQPRRAGVSSFSLMGTNVHAVVEQSPCDTRAAAPVGCVVVAVSAATAWSLEATARSLAAHLAAHPDLSAADVAATLATGRDHHAHRLAVTGSTTSEIAEALAAEAPNSAAVATGRRVVLVLPGDSGDVEQLVTLARALQVAGVTFAAAFGSGAGNLALRVVQGRSTLAEATAQGDARADAGFDHARLRDALAEVGDAVAVSVGAGTLADAVAAELPLTTVAGPGDIPSAVGILYTAGADITWPHGLGRRISLPGYHFEPTRCWCREPDDVYRRGTGSGPRLPAPQQEPPPADTFLTATEAVIARVWAQALKEPVDAPTADYFQLGGTSITGIAVVDGLDRELGVRVTFEQLYEHPTVGELGACLDDLLARGQGQDRGPELVPVPRTGELTPSFGQERLWFLDRLAPDSPLYNIPFQLRLSGALDTEALRLSLEAVVHRHEVLRSRFVEVDGQPRVVIDEAGHFPLPIDDLSGLPPKERALAASGHITAQARTPFDLGTGPLVRARLLRLAADEHVLAMTFHHVVDDGWSPAVINREVSAYYQAFVAGQPVELAPLSIQYADFAVWQREWLRGERLADEVAYWAGQLADPPALDLPGDRARPPVQTFRGGLLPFELSSDLTARVRATSRREGVTTFVTLLAAYAVFLHRLSGQDDLIVGTPTAGRSRAETRDLIGFFNNSVAIRADLSGQPTFRQVLNRLRSVAAAAIDHQDIPFETIVAELQPPRDLSRNPIFDVMYTHQNAPHAAWELPGVQVGDYDAGATGTTMGIAEGTAKFDLTLGISDVDGWDTMPGMWEYSADLFDDATVRAMIGQFTVLLDAVTADPGRELADYPLGTPAEQTQELVTWQGGRPAGPPRCFHELFEHAADRSPDAVALACGDSELTYRELDRWANGIARTLSARGVGPGALVALCAGKTPELVAALLGILKAGAAYLPLDPDYPAERLDYLLHDSGADLLLTGSGNTVPGAEDVLVVPADRQDERVASDVTPGDLAYVIYTSGSTGRPKGVEVEHRGLRNLAEEQARAFGVGPGSRVMQVVSPSFDASVSDLLLGLTAGATLVLPTGAAADAGPGLVEALAAERITHLTLPPSVLAALPDAHLPDLVTVLAAGEGLTPDVFERWGKGRRIFNPYGPTEATVYVALHEAVESRRRPNIGRAMRGAVLTVLDERQRPVPPGVPGEIHVGGVGLARGYHRRPELTTERFVEVDGMGRLYRTGDIGRRLPNGDVEFLGRHDNQVKLRGYRIELGEVEAALTSTAGVAEAAGVVRDDGSGPRLVAYVVPEGSPPAPDALRTALRERLPEYLVPSVFVVLEALPLSPNGKLDRSALPVPSGERQTSAAWTAPRTATERAVARIWSRVIGVDAVGLHDDFFDLGGHSLQATRVVSRVREIFQVELAVRLVFERPTVAGLSEEIAWLWGGPDAADEVASLVEQLQEMDEAEVGRLLSDLDVGQA